MHDLCKEKQIRSSLCWELAKLSAQENSRGEKNVVIKASCTICFKVKGLTRAQNEEEIGSVSGRLGERVQMGAWWRDLEVKGEKKKVRWEVTYCMGERHC